MYLGPHRAAARSSQGRRRETSGRVQQAVYVTADGQDLRSHWLRLVLGADEPGLRSPEPPRQIPRGLPARRSHRQSLKGTGKKHRNRYLRPEHPEDTSDGAGPRQRCRDRSGRGGRLGRPGHGRAVGSPSLVPSATPFGPSLGSPLTSASDRRADSPHEGRPGGPGHGWAVGSSGPVLFATPLGPAFGSGLPSASDKHTDSPTTATSSAAF